MFFLKCEDKDCRQYQKETAKYNHLRPNDEIVLQPVGNWTV